MSIYVLDNLESRYLLASPSVADIIPKPGVGGITPTVAVKVDVNLPNVGHGVSDSSLEQPGAVTLVRVSDGTSVPANVNTTGGGDAIVLTPLNPLQSNTEYRFTITTAVTDTSGVSFVPYTSTFTTGNQIATADPKIRFAKIELPLAVGYQWTSVAMGPDGRLYAGTQSGHIVRFTLNADGTVNNTKTIQTIRANNGMKERLITGIEFDPASNAKKPILWVSHGVNMLEGAPNFSGKITRLNGKNLEIYKDILYDLPRSARDHLTEQLKFGPNGHLYFGQPSQSAQGAPDSQWGLREETQLSGTILRIDLSKLPPKPLSVKTRDVGGTYNPFKKANPVRIFAFGVRNAFDIVFTRDGKMFAPVNSSAAGGNSPAGKGTPALTNIPTQNDFLIEVVEGGYYGHPNPTHGYYAINGGNPTSGVDSAQVASYPVGTQPDPNWRGIEYEFGRNESPDGIIEFKGDAFGGALDGSLMVAQWSAGDNIVVLSRDADGNVTEGRVGFTGLSQFIDPLDLVQNPSTGFLYVAEYGAQKITLLVPDEGALASGRRIAVSENQLVFNDVKGGSQSKALSLTIRNRGSSTLTISSLTFVGGNSGFFPLVQAPNRPFDLQPGQYTTIKIAFNPPSNTSNGLKSTTLRIASNDTAGNATLDIPLRGLATPGLEGTNEPNFQAIMDAYGLGTKIGDDNVADTRLPFPLDNPNDEVTAQLFEKAGSGPVMIEPIAAFLPDFLPAANIGWYRPGQSGTLRQVVSINKGSHQTLNPTTTGWDRFDPTSGQFGFYVQWGVYLGKTSFSQDGLNTWDTGPENGRKLRTYRLKNSDGSIVPNAYVLAGEALSSYTDQQDAVFIVRNVKPVVGASTQSVAPAASAIARPPASGPFGNRPIEGSDDLSDLI
jgi:glucose/arabinose dehydrogenase